MKTSEKRKPPKNTGLPPRNLRKPFYLNVKIQTGWKFKNPMKTGFSVNFGVPGGFIGFTVVFWSGNQL